MPGFIEQMVIETIEEYERMADEYRKKADALRVEWQSLQVDKPAEQQVDSDGWIEWAGGKCPVSRFTRVSVRFRLGEVNIDREAQEWLWTHTGASYDIVAYKIVKEEA